jgi:hypothetical protein
LDLQNKKRGHLREIETEQCKTCDTKKSDVCHAPLELRLRALISEQKLVLGNRAGLRVLDGLMTASLEAFLRISMLARV